MLTGLIVFHVILCIFITLVVLFQFGKGAEAGAMMGTSGASQNIFSTSSKGNPISKATNIMAILFIGTSLALNIMIANKSKPSIMDDEKKVIKLQKTPVKDQADTSKPADKENSAETK